MGGCTWGYGEDFDSELNAVVGSRCIIAVFEDGHCAVPFAVCLIMCGGEQARELLIRARMHG